MLPNLFEVCAPREEVLGGDLDSADFAADLAMVLKGQAPEEYQNPVSFFRNT
ncbi:MAG: hypothetical protein MJ061_05480 [Mailhella sp.]|nr:hypothetical protein [Mailhella sp.]